MGRPKLGEWCTVTAKLWRGRRWEKGSFTYKFWQRHPFPEPVKAMFIGYRTGANGIAEWIDEEVGNVFNPKEYVQMWMFVTDERSKPIYVLPEDVLQPENVR